MKQIVKDAIAEFYQEWKGNFASLTPYCTGRVKELESLGYIDKHGRITDKGRKAINETD